MIVATTDTGTGLVIHRHDDDTFEFVASTGGLSISLARISESTLCDALAQVSKGSNIPGYTDRCREFLKGEAKEAEAAMVLVR